MEILDFESTDLNWFFENIQMLKSMIEKTFEGRKIPLNGEIFLTSKDVKKALHISDRTLQEYRDECILPYIQISGGKILYKQSDILKLLEDNYHPRLQ